MSYGIFISNFDRPPSKRALKRALVEDPESVLIQNPEHLGLDDPLPATEIREGEVFEFDGPEPGDGAFEGEITRTHGRLVIR